MIRSSRRREVTRPFLAAGFRGVVLITDPAYGGGEPPGAFANSEDDTAERCSPQSLASVGAVTLEALDRIAERLAKIDRFVEARVPRAGSGSATPSRAAPAPPAPAAPRARRRRERAAGARIRRRRAAAPRRRRRSVDAPRRARVRARRRGFLILRRRDPRGRRPSQRCAPCCRSCCSLCLPGLASAAPPAGAAKSPVRIQVESPRPGEPVTNKVDQAPIRGNAMTEGDKPAAFDVMIVIDVSGSTKVASGVDVDRDGEVGFNPQLELLEPGAYPAGHRLDRSRTTRSSPPSWPPRTP